MLWSSKIILFLAGPNLWVYFITGPRKNTLPRQPYDKRVGDWSCPNVDCRYLNFSWREICLKCPNPRPAVVNGVGSNAGGHGGPKSGRSGTVIVF